jgi:hypothetical protein
MCARDILMELGIHIRRRSVMRFQQLRIIISAILYYHYIYLKLVPCNGRKIGQRCSSWRRHATTTTQASTYNMSMASGCKIHSRVDSVDATMKWGKHHDLDASRNTATISSPSGNMLASSRLHSRGSIKGSLDARHIDYAIDKTLRRITLFLFRLKI